MGPLRWREMERRKEKKKYEWGRDGALEVLILTLVI
jgi:hypothetical protein